MLLKPDWIYCCKEESTFWLPG